MPTNLGNGVWSSDGSFNDTQTAVNDAPDGGTVLLPAGTFTWQGQLKISNLTYSDGSPKGKSVNLFGAPLVGGVPVTIIVNDWKGNGPFTNTQLIDVQTSPNFNMEVKWLTFQEGPLIPNSNGNMHFFITNRGNFGISANSGNRGKVMLMHDCTLSNSGNMSYLVRFAMPTGGVVWNTTFTSAGAGNADGIIAAWGDDYEFASTMGTLDTTGLRNLYVELCTFTGWANGFALDLGDGCRAVVRHCTFNNSLIGTHGQESGPFGVRHFEVYSNVFQNADNVKQTPYTWMSIRGGTFNIYSNNFGALPTGASNNTTLQCLALQRKDPSHNPPQPPLNCPTTYPIPRQIGQGWSGAAPPTGHSYPSFPGDGGGYILDPAYYWSNTIAGGNLYGWADDTDTCGNGLHASNFVQAGIDFINNGSTAKPGYTAFTYPHPLTNSPNTTSVPNCVGLTESAADTAIQNANLVVGTDAFQSGGTAGQVVSQVPAANTTAAIGATVTLTISQGASNVATPNCIGLTETAADSAITGTTPALVVGTDVFTPSSTVAAGTVISQLPLATTVVPGGTAVDLTISSGPSTAVWQLVQSNIAAGSSVSSLPVAFTSANVAGHLLVAMIGTGNQTINSVSDPTNGNWTYGGTTATNAGQDAASLYYKANCAGAGPLTVTLSISAVAFPNMCIAEFTPNSSTQDTAGSLTGNSTAAAGVAINLAPITTRDVNDLVIAVFKGGADQTGNFTAGPGLQTIGAIKGFWCGFTIDSVAGTASAPPVSYTPSVTPNVAVAGQFATVTYAFVPPPVTVGNYLGLLEPLADAAVQNGGLTLGPDIFAPRLTGYVIAQSPPPGAVVPSGTVVTLTIYSGTA